MRSKHFVDISGEVDGYDFATLYAVDTTAKEETRQTRRDVATHASDTFSDKPSFSLQLTSGERLRMSLTGSVTTARRDYDIHTLPHTSQKRDADDVMHVLVTWKDHQNERRDLHDVLEIPDDSSSEARSDPRRSVRYRNATVEIGDFVDRFFIEELNHRRSRWKLGNMSNHQVLQLIILKWSGAASLLSNKTKVGWDLILRLVNVTIMRTDPTWYQLNPNQTIGERLNAICLGTKDRHFDQVTLHTGRTSNPGLVGLAYGTAVCRHRWRCAASRSYRSDYWTELHELGHSLGLNHDGKMHECVNGTDPTKGFMGGNKYHFRACYKDVLARTLPKKTCLFSNYYSNYVKQFN
ncbi:uncharacterized protein LOC143289346 [Babylonia areolata]|uniref:uncharacterized protein LOC143289346 n=1 Tax=Babylonia areolata TaxID=304850 RepID=UPI003FCFA513